VAPNDKKSLDAIEKLTGKPIEKAEVEGVPEAALGDPTDRGGRGRRAEELKREHSKRISEKKQKYMKRDTTRGEAGTEPVKAAAPKSEAPSPKPRAARRDEPRREDARKPARDDGGSGVQGFGDSTPAFLRKK